MTRGVCRAMLPCGLGDINNAMALSRENLRACLAPCSCARGGCGTYSGLCRFRVTSVCCVAGGRAFCARLVAHWATP
jgi:hypothetical protein